MTHRLPVRRVASLPLACALSLGALASRRVAFAQEEVEIDVAPPPPRVEVVGTPPSPRHFWIHGYYGWVNGAHYWVPGRWEVMRAGWSWSEARWAIVGRRWHFYPGHWYR